MAPRAIPATVTRPRNAQFEPAFRCGYGHLRQSVHCGYKKNSVIREVVTAKPTLTLYNVTMSDAGQLFCLHYQSYGSMTSSNAVLTIVLPPTIIAQPTNQMVAAVGRQPSA